MATDATTNDQMSFLLRYSGPAVNEGSMDVYEAAANMVAFSEYVVVAAREVFGPDSEVKAEVHGYGRGSFTTDLLFHVAGAGAALWAASPDLGGLFVVVRESLGLFRFLKGEKASAVKQINNNEIQVTNNSGQVIVIQAASFNVTMDPKAGSAAEQFVAKALSMPGMVGVDVSTNGAQLALVEKDDASYYHDIAEDEDVKETTVEMQLVIDQPGFRESLKWRFWDGENYFAAAVTDDQFIAAVDAGEAFRKGDTLTCLVTLRQTKTTRGALRLERTIVKVLRHTVRPNQPALPL